MADLKEMLQTADWKTEKHVPIIDCPDIIKKGQDLEIGLYVGKELKHPNTTEHHIKYMELYFLPEGEKFPYQVGHYGFTTHGESTQGPNTSSVFSEPKINVSLKTEKSGQLMAISYCNIHGIWKNERQIKVG